ncbi:MAG: hypothetical protein RIA69_14390 [Cyclobacteriaceae bacterium]
MTNKRVLLKSGATFSIQGDDETFSETDPLNKIPESLSSREKFELIENKYNQPKKVFTSGSMFKFRIGVGRVAEDDVDREYWFSGRLLEDLYFYVTDKEKIRLCPCDCVMEQITSGEILFVEKVFGLSLNNLFSNVVTFYLPLQRSGSADSFTTFYFNGRQLEEEREIYDAELEAMKREKQLNELK